MPSVSPRLQWALRCAAGLACLTPALAWAVPTITITSPRAGDCINSGQPVIEGTVGGDPLDAPVDLTLGLSVRSAVAGPATITVRVDGVEVHAEPLDLDADALEETQVRVPADAVEDGRRRVVEVRVTAGDGEAADTVEIDLDRRPPNVLFAEEVIALQGQCFDEPPDIEYLVEDAVDEAPDVVEEIVEVPGGCGVERIITVRDACVGGGFEGNAQEVRFITRRPSEAEPEVVIVGIAEGERVLTGVLRYRTGVPSDCLVTDEATYVRDDRAPAPWGDGAVFDQPGDYVATVEIEACGAPPITAERRFTVVPEPRVDAGGPYISGQGQALMLSAAESVIPVDVVGAITEYAWDLDADGFFDPDEGRAEMVPFDTDQPDGVYDIGLRITTAGGFVGYGYTTVTLTDVSPECDAGGPYVAAQGEVIVFDASGSTPGNPDEPILLYAWDFGDGSSRRAGRPETTHDYLEEGEYVVTLRVEDEDSFCEAEAQVTITDVSPIVEGLSIVGDPPREGDAVRFSAGLTSAGSFAEPITRYEWTFGDGSPPVQGGVLRSPEHTFADNGTYEVCLEAFDADSSARGCLTVEVSDLLPTARVSGPRFAVEGREVSFDARDSRAGGLADPLTRFVWDFGDGTPPVERPADEPDVEHAFQADGELTVTLLVFDEDGSSLAELEVFVDDASPTARFAVDTGGLGAYEGTPVTLDASASVGGSAGDPIVEYRWDFGDGTARSGPDLAVVEHSWPDQGDYQVRLRVIDADGSPAVANEFVPVLNRAPAEVRITGPEVAELGREVRFEVAYADVEADVPAITWRLGDGTVVEGRDSVTHTYDAIPRTGSVTVRVTVDDRDGGTAQAERTVTITRAGPEIDGPAVVELAEGAVLDTSWTVQAAPLGVAFDGPVEVSVPTAPAGASVEITPENPAGVSRVRVTWPAGFDDAGRHRLVIIARAPSGLERVLPVDVTVTEQAGTWLAAAGGDTVEGRITVYSFTRDPVRDVEVFDVAGDFPVSGGARGLAVDPQGHVYAAVPGAGMVAVVALNPAPRLVRQIPIGGQPAAVAAGPVGAFAAAGGTIVAIDAEALKAGARADLTEARIADLLYLTAGDGFDVEPVVLAADDAGTLHVLDPQQLAEGGNPVRAQHALGAGLRRVVVTGDAVWVVDGLGRRMFELDPTRLLGDTDGAIRRTVAVPFAPIDVAVVDGVVWFASERGLERLDPDGPTLVSRESLRALAELPAWLYGQPALAVGGRERVGTLDAASQTELDNARGGGARRLLPFIRPTP